MRIKNRILFERVQHRLGPPHTGGPGQTAPVAPPPPVGTTATISPVSLVRQQVLWLVMQSRALSSSPISFRVTILLFWYVVPLSNATINEKRQKKSKKEQQHATTTTNNQCHSVYVLGNLLNQQTYLIRNTTTI